MLRKCVLGLAILIACVTFITNKAFAISIGVNPALQTVLLGDSFNVTIDISGLGLHSSPSLSAFDLDLSFDGSILGLNNVVFGDPILGDQLALTWPSQNDYTPAPGTVNLWEYSLDSEDDLVTYQADYFTLATLAFTTLGPGSSFLTLSINDLMDEGVPPSLGGTHFPLHLTATLSNGSVTVANPVPEPSTYLLFLFGMLGVAGIRKRECWKS